MINVYLRFHKSTIIEDGFFEDTIKCTQFIAEKKRIRKLL